MKLYLLISKDKQIITSHYTENDGCYNTVDYLGYSNKVITKKDVKQIKALFEYIVVKKGYTIINIIAVVQI